MLRRMLVVALAAGVLAGCGLATHYPAPTGSLTTMIPGWERFFSIDWTAGPAQGGFRTIDGYVYNRYGNYAADMRLLVQTLDASGNVVDQRVVWGPTGVGGFGRAYFYAPHMPVADQYRVSVWDYRLIQGAMRESGTEAP
jgi:hypothetical protein